jgi:CubicO group peptidase (beta-lactamase class C family)
VNVHATAPPEQRTQPVRHSADPPRRRPSWPFWAAVVVVVSAVSTLASTLIEATGSAPTPPAAVVPATTPPPGPAHPLTTADVDTWLDGVMPTALASGDIAGAEVVVVKDGKVLSQRGYGYADVASRTPVDPERTLMRPGSVSKLFTWTAVMQLVEQGELDLDADISTYLDFPIPARDDGPITLRNLMTHTAGFEEQVKDLLGTDPAATPSFEELLRRWVPERIYAAGSTPAYSNYGCALAGYIVERVSGEPFADYVQKHVFDPLGMKSSTFQQPVPAALQGNLSTGYLTATADPVPFEVVGMAPAGALSATGADMARFMLAHLQGGQLNGQRILRPETTAEMHETATSPVPPLNRMLLGFFESNVNGHEVIGHLGDTTAFHSAVHLFTKDNTGLYVIANSGGANGAAGTVRVEVFDQFADRYFPGPAPTTARVDAATAAQHAAMMTGTWSSTRRSDSTFFSLTDLLGQVSVGTGPNGELIAPASPGFGGQNRRWVEVEPFVWQDVDSHERLAAVVEDGRVTRFSIDQLAPVLEFERTPAGRDSALLLPLLYASLAVLLLTVLLWPVAAVIRRRSGGTLGLQGVQLLGHRLTRLTAILVLVTLVGWAVTIMTMAGGALFTSAFDTPLLLLQGLSFLAFGGGLLVLLWTTWLAFRGRRPWPTRILNVATVLSVGVVLWIGISFHLLGFTTQY